MENNWPYFTALDFRERHVLYCAWRPGSSEETIRESADDLFKKDLCSVPAQICKGNNSIFNTIKRSTPCYIAWGKMWLICFSEEFSLWLRQHFPNVHTHRNLSLRYTTGIIHFSPLWRQQLNTDNTRLTANRQLKQITTTAVFRTEHCL